MIGFRMSGEGKARASLPKVSWATFSAMMPTAMVASSQAGEARRKKGRTATRSTSAPKHGRATRVTNERQREGPAQAPTKTAYATTAPSITAWPWEKFMVRLVAQVMWYPRATSPYMLPRARPVTSSWVRMGSGPTSC